MSSVQATRPAVWFWVIAVVMTLWNAAGVWAYIAQVSMTAEALAALPEAERVLYTDVPSWATGAFAIAVFGGLLGCLAMLMRKAWALPLFVFSLAGVVVQMAHALLLTDALEVYGGQGLIGPSAVFVVALFLVWFSSSAKKRGWLS